jgi:hypothetical protein
MLRVTSTVSEHSHNYGGKSLHDQSHSESFISLLQNRFTLRERQPFQLVSRFVAEPERYMHALFSKLSFNED